MTVPQNMIKELDEFFASKTIQDIDRNTFLICNLHDKTNKLTISLVFLRDWDSLETDSYNSVILQNKGAVFTFPCYWVSVPKELAVPYIEYILSEFYENTVSGWLDSGIDNGFPSGDNRYPGKNNCPCC